MQAPTIRLGGKFMRIRTTREVIEDHLRRRATGDLDGDLHKNYDPDVIVLHPDGEARGHEGIRHLAERFSRYQIGGSLRCHRLLTSGEIGVLEWSGLGGRNPQALLQQAPASSAIGDRHGNLSAA